MARKPEPESRAVRARRFFRLGLVSGGGTYTVKPGESYFSIAGNVCGNQRFFEQLQQYNPNLKNLRPGMVIRLPRFRTDVEPTVSFRAAAEAGLEIPEDIAESIGYTNPVLDEAGRIVTPGGTQTGVTLPETSAPGAYNVQAIQSLAPSQQPAGYGRFGGPGRRADQPRNELLETIGRQFKPIGQALQTAGGALGGALENVNVALGGTPGRLASPSGQAQISPSRPAYPPPAAPTGTALTGRPSPPPDFAEEFVGLFRNVGTALSNAPKYISQGSLDIIGDPQLRDTLLGMGYEALPAGGLVLSDTAQAILFGETSGGGTAFGTGSYPELGSYSKRIQQMPAPRGQTGYLSNGGMNYRSGGSVAINWRISFG